MLDQADVHIQPIAPPRFDIETESQELRAFLASEGFAVVKDVCEGRTEELKSLMWDFMENVEGTSVRRDSPSSWSSPTDWIPCPRTGIISGFGFGHSEFMWQVRLLPKVRETFTSIWRTDDLLVSFDGGNVFRPWRLNPEWRTGNGWWHVDQNANRPRKRGLKSVQGLVTLLPANEETGGLVVIPKSHLQHNEICSRLKYAKSMGDFVPIEKNDPILEGGGLLICAEAGDLILWDSRTIHCNTSALVSATSNSDKNKDASAKPSETPSALIRQVAYVTMTPAAWATEETLGQRRQAFVERWSTSHWPHELVMTGVPPPGTPPLDPEKITPEQRRLIGYDRPNSRCTLM